MYKTYTNRTPIDCDINTCNCRYLRWVLVASNPCFVRLQVLTAASMKLRVFWDVAPCSLIEVDWRFRGAYCLHHQGDKQALSETIAGYIAVDGPSPIQPAVLSRTAYSSPWWLGQYAPLKRRSTSTWLHGATSQKTLNFILALVFYEPCSISAEICTCQNKNHFHGYVSIRSSSSSFRD
jgi:hypothetical protein